MRNKKIRIFCMGMAAALFCASISVVDVLAYNKEPSVYAAISVTIPGIGDMEQPNLALSEESTSQLPSIGQMQEAVVEAKKEIVKKAEEAKWFQIPDGTYNYCPSVIAGSGVFYCSNTTPYKIRDHICFSRIQAEADGTIRFYDRSVVLSPTSGSWDSVHVCDPSVVSGNFSYQGTNYRYLIAYLGCNTTDNSKNQIGVAVSNSLSGGWVKVGANPLIPCEADALWGTGQPSVISLDPNGRVVIFYTKGTSAKTCTKAQEWDLSNLDAPQLLGSSVVSDAGMGDFISNADVAYSNGWLMMVCDRHPFGNGVLSVAARSGIYSAAWDGNISSLASLSWQKEGEVSPEKTGYAKNHNCGLAKTLTGALAERTVVYTGASEKGTFLDSLCTYRLRQCGF